MVFRVHKTENYTIMSNHHLQDTRLTLKAKGLMSLMLSLPADWDYSAKGLATLSKDKEDAIRTALKELEEYHYLKRTPIRESGIIKDWQYDIYEIPESLENRASQPEVDLPQVDKPLVEKQPQINTNKQNTKERSNNSNKLELEAEPTNRLFVVSPNPIKTSATTKKNKYEQCVDEIEKFTSDLELRGVLITYLKMRLEMRDCPMYKNQWVGMLNKLKDLSDSVTEQIEIVQQSINRGYKGFFEVKKYSRQGRVQDPAVFNEFGKVKTGKGIGGNLTNVQF